MYSEKLVELLGPARRREGPIEARHQDIAASLQAVTEKVMIRLAQAARAYLHAQARTLTHLDEVAAALGVSSDHLRHEFKRTYGHSLVRELMEVRVGLAEAMLTQSRLPLAVVSRECGFHSEGYLCRVFRLLRGHSPRGREHQKVPSPTDS